MNTAWTILIMMASAATPAALAREHALKTPPDVTVCMDSRSESAFFFARAQTSAMFARIGVKLEWRTPDSCPAGALQISLSDDTPPNFKPVALGYAKPYDGTHIVVLWDRVKTLVTR
jgi:hypothetical protein